jgi:hypothetical protein
MGEIAAMHGSMRPQVAVRADRERNRGSHD